MCISILHLITLFSEDLDEHNPWYCPRCQRNQCAKKTITVWQYPDTLILHLKRSELCWGFGHLSVRTSLCVKPDILWWTAAKVTSALQNQFWFYAAAKKKLLPVEYMYMSGKLCINANQRGHRWKKVGIPKSKLSIKVNSIKYDSVFSGLCITICPVTKWTQRWSTPSRIWIYPSTPQGPTQAVWPMTCTALYAILVVRIKYTQIVLICQIYIQK